MGATVHTLCHKRIVTLREELEAKCRMLNISRIIRNIMLSKTHAISLVSHVKIYVKLFYSNSIVMARLNKCGVLFRCKYNEKAKLLTLNFESSSFLCIILFLHLTIGNGLVWFEWVKTKPF